ncbi:LrgB family protein [Oceanobacillus sp. CFH 90083]|uniref:LrgB family protein n=1 Tax=Oceanobacillus sp. CFH 90083 TaxID=2592336 RepID=UPI00128DCEA0|nr:LrgB family protein [Oceanobacillus sp. CFH 90083]
MNNVITGIIAVAATFLLYRGSKRIYMYKPSSFTLPIFLSTSSIVILMLLTGISYETYMIGGRWLDFFLGPIVVSLAVPLYREIKLIKKYAGAITIGIFAGSLTGVITGIAGAKLFGFERWVSETIASKSVTAPIAIRITETAGGNISLTAVFVTIAGISGAMFGPVILKMCRIHHPVAKGLSIGTASHAIGTAKVLENSQMEGAVSALSMTVSAVIVSFLAPIFLSIM